ncbi:MAG: class I tRNA ligase family protein, partial [Anaerolineaceae bacterium]|nr:class I tRNA ligase family protein [Anaerolineaceae bacterium]
FVTEELWGHLKRAATLAGDAYQPKQGWEDALIIARWPEAQEEEAWENEKVESFLLVQNLIRGIRNLRAEKKVTPGKRLPATLLGGEKTTLFKEQAVTIAALSYIDPANFQILETIAEKPQGQTSLVISGIEMFIPLAEAVDTVAEKARIEKELAEADSHITRLQALLSSSFAEKAPAALVDKERQKLAAFIETAAKLKEQL